MAIFSNVISRIPLVHEARGRLRSASAPFLFTGFALSFVNATSAPLLPLLRDTFKVNTGELALVSAISGVGMVLVDWPVGYFVPRLGARRMVLLGLVPLTLGPIVSLTAMSFLWLLAGSALTG